MIGKISVQVTEKLYDLMSEFFEYLRVVPSGDSVSGVYYDFLGFLRGGAFY